MIKETKITERKKIVNTVGAVCPFVSSCLLSVDSRPQSENIIEIDIVINIRHRKCARSFYQCYFLICDFLFRVPFV